MKLQLSACVLALAALASFPLLSSAGQGTTLPSSVKNVIQHELLVVYDITGSTFAGPIDLSLEVYNDGLAKISGVVNGVGDARVAHIGSAAALQLAVELRQANAWGLTDQMGTFNDVPLKTITVLRGTSAQLGHSYSYYSPQGDYQAAEFALVLFISNNFPGF